MVIPPPSGPDVRRSGMLGHDDLVEAMADGNLSINPLLGGDCLQPASIELHLGPVMRFYHKRSKPVDTRDIPADLTYEVDMNSNEDRALSLSPGVLFLASTVEHIQLDHTVGARVDGKSTLGRLGLSIHCTAGFVDPGFVGNITLEIKNENKFPIVVYANMPICQLVVFRLDTPTSTPYGSEGLGSRYQGQVGPTEAYSG